MEGVVEHHDGRALRCVARDLDRVLHCLGPRVREHRLAGHVAGDQRIEPLGERQVRLAHRHVDARVGEPIELLTNGFHDRRGGIPGVEDGQPCAQVDQAVAVDVADDRACRGFDEDRMRVEDAAGERRLPSLEEAS